MSSRTRMLGAGRAGSTVYGSNVNMIQFGDRLQGLAPQATHFFISGNGKAGWNQYQSRTYAPKRNYVFCMNQLGGVGKGKSQFKVGGLNNPDGAKSCKPYEYKSISDDKSKSNDENTMNNNVTGSGVNTEVNNIYYDSGDHKDTTKPIDVDQSTDVFSYAEAIKLVIQRRRDYSGARERRNIDAIKYWENRRKLYSLPRFSIGSNENDSQSCWTVANMINATGYDIQNVPSTSNPWPNTWPDDSDGSTGGDISYAPASATQTNLYNQVAFTANQGMPTELGGIGSGVLGNFTSLSVSVMNDSTYPDNITINRKSCDDDCYYYTVENYTSLGSYQFVYGDYFFPTVLGKGWYNDCNQSSYVNNLPEEDGIVLYPEFVSNYCGSLESGKYCNQPFYNTQVLTGPNSVNVQQLIGNYWNSGLNYAPPTTGQNSYFITTNLNELSNGLAFWTSDYGDETTEDNVYCLGSDQTNRWNTYIGWVDMFQYALGQTPPYTPDQPFTCYETDNDFSQCPGTNAFPGTTKLDILASDLRYDSIYQALVYDNVTQNSGSRIYPACMKKVPDIVSDLNPTIDGNGGYVGTEVMGVAFEGCWQIDIRPVTVDPNKILPADTSTLTDPNQPFWCETFYLAERENMAPNPNYYLDGSKMGGNGKGGNYGMEIDIFESLWNTGPQCNLPNGDEEGNQTGWNTSWEGVGGYCFPSNMNQNQTVSWNQTDQYMGTTGTTSSFKYTFGCLIRDKKLWFYGYKTPDDGGASEQWYASEGIEFNNNQYTQKYPFVPYIGSWLYIPSQVDPTELMESDPNAKAILEYSPQTQYTGYSNYVYLPPEHPCINGCDPKTNPDKFGEALYNIRAPNCVQNLYNQYDAECSGALPSNSCATEYVMSTDAVLSNSSCIAETWQKFYFSPVDGDGNTPYSEDDFKSDYGTITQDTSSGISYVFVLTANVDIYPTGAPFNKPIFSTFNAPYISNPTQYTNTPALYLYNSSDSNNQVDWVGQQNGNTCPFSSDGTCVQINL
jgi:hypothetical protein